MRSEYTREKERERTGYVPKPSDAYVCNIFNSTKNSVIIVPNPYAVMCAIQIFPYKNSSDECGMR